MCEQITVDISSLHHVYSSSSSSSTNTYFARHSVLMTNYLLNCWHGSPISKYLSLISEGLQLIGKAT